MPKKGFSNKELIDIVKSWIAISLVFAIAFSGFSLTYDFLLVLGASALTAGLGFLLHELGHRYVARRYHCWAEFKSFDTMLLVALLLSTLGLIFAAPGAVMIKGHVTKKKHGHIAAAGPIMNIILGIAFLILGFVFTGPVAVVAGYGVKVNGWLAAFNALPFGPLDGTKIFAWNRTVGIALIVGGVVLAFL